MSAHLLSLATLHATAPGVLDVVFGLDGAFEGAPAWCGPVWARKGLEATSPYQWLTVSSLADGGDVCYYEPSPDTDEDEWHAVNAALDLRIPSVAARLAGLCARALGNHHGDLWQVFIGDGTAKLESPRHAFMFVSPRLDAHTGAVDLPDEAFASKAAFLAALTLALAPRIRDLGGKS